MTADQPFREPEGGEPVCWMHLLCPSCGAMPETPDDGEPAATTCPRCGEELER